MRVYFGLLFLLCFPSFASSLGVPGHHVEIVGCESYPYYSSLEVQEGGNARLKNDFYEALAVAKSCLKRHEFAPMVKKGFGDFLEVVTNDLKKTLTCNYGVTNSFFAVASDPETGEHQDHGLPPHPSVIFDTNRMAANFPLGLDLEKRENFVLFYGGKLSLEEVISGTRNPFQSPVKHTESLVFHEMFHWTGHSHFPKKNLDIVYLAQFCCFPQVDHSAQEQQRACELLEDPEAWQENEKARLEYIKEHGLQAQVRELIRKYH